MQILFSYITYLAILFIVGLGFRNPPPNRDVVGKIPHAVECPNYDIPSDGEAPALKLWEILSTSSLPLFPGNIW